jgi:hypothetical protein
MSISTIISRGYKSAKFAPYLEVFFSAKSATPPPLPKEEIPFWEVMNRLLEACGAWFDVWDLIYTLN